MTASAHSSTTPEVDLDPAAEPLTRHVSSAASAALAVTQHALQAATARSYLARGATSTEARRTRAIANAQVSLDRAVETSERLSAHPDQWSAYHDGSPAAVLGGLGVSIPPQQVLAHAASGRSPRTAPASAPEPGIALGSAMATSPAAPEIDR
jgi:hypothetical protein